MRSPVILVDEDGVILHTTTVASNPTLDVNIAGYSGANAATGTTTSVASSASSVNLLALNTSRKGASVFNDSTVMMYVKLGTTASSTSHTVQVVPLAYYEVPFGYTGRIDGIWVSATGSARITEFT